ncbi:MAG: recombinase family protein [Candidatus Cryosericum sp.]
MNTSLNAEQDSKANDATYFTFCAAYIRTGVSGEVDDCLSLAQQKSQLEDYAFERGWTICEWYEDEGFSGVTIERPALKQLMTDVETHCFDRILVVQIDRLARRIDDFSTIVTKLAALSVEVTSVTPAFDTSTAAGRLVCGVCATLAQWEKEMSLGDEPLECSVIWGESDDTPATRFMGNVILALLEFEREQGDEYTARADLLLHSVDLQGKGAQ